MSKKKIDLYKAIILLEDKKNLLVCENGDTVQRHTNKQVVINHCRGIKNKKFLERYIGKKFYLSNIKR